MTETTRRLPTWVVALAAALLGAVLGAGILSAQAQTEEPEPGPTSREAFVACAEQAGITLPDLRQHWRDRERLSDEERTALGEARETCGDLLPHAEERAVFRQCLVDTGVLGPDGERPDPSSLDDGERRDLRAGARECAEANGIERPRRCRPRPHGED